MATVVLTPPDPILTPADIAGDHEATDPTIEALIAAATEEIDGPTGWLGRAIGPQTLRMTMDGFPCATSFRLSCVPVIDIDEIAYVDTAGATQILADTGYALDRLSGKVRLVDATAWPATADQLDSVTVTFQAGYDGYPVADDGTGDIPERIKHAIKLMVQDMQSTQAATGGLKVDQVDGVSRREYFPTGIDTVVMSRTVERLLSGLRVIW